MTSIKSHSTTEQSPSTSSKSWVILQVSRSEYYRNQLHHQDAQILCSVDSYQSVETAAVKLEDLIFRAFDCDPSLFFIRCISVERNTKEGLVLLKTTVEHLVEHLRELEVWPSLEPGRPNLWGSGGNALKIYFKSRKSEREASMSWSGRSSPTY